ncbi:MAG: glucose 1-dehydrogenase [Phycisphaerales bacterium]|nr:MAG: glucose 1-dehydrogenase [Phycisphaerales bacterium]
MESKLFDLAGRTALITGAGRGIGRALALGLAQHGADVVLVARSEDQLRAAAAQIETETGRTAWVFPLDLEQLDGIETMFAQVLEAAGAVDILVNCAGTTVRGPSEDVSLEIFNRVMRVNLTAALLLSQAFCKHRRQTGGSGRIINIGSLACHAGRPTIAAYTCSKTGLLGLTKTLAVEWAQHHINVNAIGPGYIATELTVPLQADADFNQWALSKTPLGRWGKPEDLVGTAVLLASRAGDFITGQIFYVDGGWTALI